MKCPYNVNIEQVNQWCFDYNDDNLTTFEEHKLVEQRYFLDCTESDCGAWKNGECHYKD